MIRSGNTGSPAQTVAYGYNPADEMTTRNGAASGLAYDNNGNETAYRGSSDLQEPIRSSTLNVRDQITSVATTAPDNSTGTTTLSYAGATNTMRTGISTTSSAGASTGANLLTGPLGLQVRQDTTSSGAPTSYTRTPTGTLVAATMPDGTSRYYGTDYLGSVTVVVNSTGTAVARYTYDPYGGYRANGTGTEYTNNPYRFGGAYGGYTDNSTGLIKLGARYYNPEGRFTQPDPSGQEPNPYLYAGSDPINRTDPTGLFGWSTFGFTLGRDIAAGAAAGFFGGLATAIVGPEGPIITAIPATLIGAAGGLGYGLVDGTVQGFSG